MALSIIVPEAVLDEPNIIELITTFQRRSANNQEHALGTIVNFSGAGESKFSAQAYQVCDAYGCIMDKGMFYHVFTEALKDNLVPVDYPGSKVMNDEGKEVRVSYEDYFRKETQYDLGDGTWLFRIARPNVSLSNTDRLIYQADLGTLMVKSEGVALIPTIDEGM